jgi:outer membrane protein insertion porin family
MSIRSGDPFSYKKITDSQLDLRRFGAFSGISIDTIGLEERHTTVHLRVKVEEQKPFILDVDGGYSTDTKFTGSLGFTNVNSFGRAKVTNLKLTGGRELSRAEANWIDPRFLGSDFEMTDSGWLQYENVAVYSYIQGGGGFGFLRRFHRTGVVAKWELMRNYFIQGDSTAADADSLRNNTISKIALSANFDTRNSFADPTKGIFTMAGVNFYNEIKGKEANFVRISYSIGQYLGFLRYLTLSNSIRFDDIYTIGKDISVPSNELLLMGGDYTLRGFARDSLGPQDAAGKATGGRIRLIYNAELSLKVWKNFKLAGFFDSGFLVNEFSAVSGGVFRRSAGFGLRYVTPVGPLRLDYGIILDRKTGENFGRLHFLFGYAF